MSRVKYPIQPLAAGGAFRVPPKRRVRGRARARRAQGITLPPQEIWRSAAPEGGSVEQVIAWGTVGLGGLIVLLLLGWAVCYVVANLPVAEGAIARLHGEEHNGLCAWLRDLARTIA